MSEQERKIIFTNDLDGVHFRTPPVPRHITRAWRGEMGIPPVGREVGVFSPKEGMMGRLSSRWSVLYHQVKPVNQEALAGLETFRQIAEAHERDIRFAALSGREVDKHDMTRRVLERSGHLEYFTALHLNTGTSATAWKESVVKSFLDEDMNVVHIEDDLKAGLGIARLDGLYEDDRVLVYMMRTLANHPRMIERSGVEIPPNLHFVRNFAEAAEDFEQRLAAGAL